jgi:hypothetical protein
VPARRVATTWVPALLVWASRVPAQVAAYWVQAPKVPGEAVRLAPMRQVQPKQLAQLVQVPLT